MTNKRTDTCNLMLTILKNQRDNNEMPCVNDAFRRLNDSGYNDDDIYEMCLAVMASEYYRIIKFRQKWNMERYCKDIKRLPVMPWEDDGSEYLVEISRKDVYEKILENPGFTLESDENIKKHYINLREQFNNIQKGLSPFIKPDMIVESAKLLGIYRNDTIFFDSEDAIAVVIDHAMYVNPKQRMKIIKSYRSRLGRYIDTNSSMFLDAVEKVEYQVLICKDIMPGIGVVVANMLTGDLFRLNDINLSTVATENLVLCSNIIKVDGMYMTTGSPLPIHDVRILKLIQDDIEKYIENIDSNKNLPDGVSFKKLNGDLSTCIIKTLLRNDVMECTRFV